MFQLPLVDRGNLRQWARQFRVERNDPVILFHQRPMQARKQLAVAAGKGSPEARSTAREALKIPESVIRSTADYSIDPRLIRAERLKAARALEALKQ